MEGICVIAGHLTAPVPVLLLSFLPMVTLEGKSFGWRKVEAAQITESILGEQLLKRAIQPTYKV